MSNCPYRGWVLVVTRYTVPAEQGEEFRSRALTAVRALADRPGCTGVRLGRAVDDVQLWTLTSTWESVGAYRRALSSYEVKLHAVPLMYLAFDEPTAFEDLAIWTPQRGVEEHEPALAADAATVNLGEAAGPVT